MSISKRSVTNVLRKVYAIDPLGKQDMPKEQTPVKTEVPPQAPETLQIMNRIFFYDADPNKKISFSNLNDILTGTDDNDKQELLNNLKGGNTADFHADYFKWRALFVKAVSQKDQTKVVVYRFDLNPWGTKASGGDMIKTNVAGFNPPSPDDVAKDTNYKLFATINEIPDMVSLSQGPEAIYSTDRVSDQFSTRLLSARAETTVAKKMNYDNFKTNIFAYFRIWVPINVNELRNVDGSKPTTDQLPLGLQRSSPGHYKGGGDFFKKFVTAGKYNVGEKMEAPVTSPVEQQPEKIQEKAPEFTPVTKEANLVEIKEDKGRGVMHYTGSYDIMQKLVEAQHKKMKIRKEALAQAGQGGTVFRPPKVNTPVPIGNVQETKKVVVPLLNASKKLETLMKGLPGSGVQQTSQAVTVGTGMGVQSSVKSVLKKYFGS
jgi:hypothetical protein